MANSIFPQNSQQEIFQRLEKLKLDSVAQWGKMNNAQMLAHLSAQLRIAMGDLNGPIELPNWILPLIKFGGLQLPWIKNILKAPKPMVIQEAASFYVEKEAFQMWLMKFLSYPKGTTFKPHPLLGKLTYDEWGQMAYKHIDYHFKQFGI